MNAHAELIARFYERFDARDADGMLACYHAEVAFRDPVFGTLDAATTAAMWHMLTSQATDLRIEAQDIKADADEGAARWVATYTLPATGRRIRNVIDARFRFQDGLIVQHTDSFSLWRWAGMALGAKGWLLGWTPLVRRKIRSRARRSLERAAGG